jgi:uncharacterized RDD family membrane protein YckC
MAARRKREGIADSAGRAAFYPARVAARAWRGRFESAADEVLAAPEIARVLDRALAGSLPEELAQSLIRHQVIERVVRELAASGELERMIERALASPQTLELTDRVLASEEMQRVLKSTASSPELRHAIASQSTGLAEEVVGGARRAAARADQRAPSRSQVYAGVASRGLALAIDSLVALVIFACGSALVSVIGSLVGGVGSGWLAGFLLGTGWTLFAGAYFALFWSAAGQTPGMRLMRLRVSRPGGSGISLGRAIIRVIGLFLAIIPLFAGFIPALFDRQRRALPDYLAGTVVVYDDTRTHEHSSGVGRSSG